MCISVLPVCMLIMGMPGAGGGHQRASGSLELELNSGILQEQQVLITAKQCLQLVVTLVG